MNTLTSRGIVLLSLALASCGFSILSGPSPDSRQNIADEVPAFIVNGTTTQEEVLLKLGEPDGATAGDRQFIYVQSSFTAGYIAGFYQSAWGAYEKAYDRLIIQFNDKNVVTSARHERISCTEKYDSNRLDEPCVNVANLDLRLNTNGVVFKDTAWCRGIALRGWLFTPSTAIENGCLVGAIAISDAAIFLFPEHATNKSEPIWILPYTEVASVEKLTRFLYGSYAIILKRSDGTYDTIRVPPYVSPDAYDKMEKLLLPHVRAAATK